MRDDRISSMLAERIAAGDFPSAVYIVAEGGIVVFADALGDAVKSAVRHPATLETIYDLASLTKPLVTGLLCARHLEKGDIRLDDSLAEYLPDFHRAEKRSVTLRHLLTHTSGLPAWRPLYLLAEDRESVSRIIAEEALEFSPGTHVRYSDLGFILLGLLLEKLSARPLSQIAKDEIVAPLELTRTFFTPNESLFDTIAANEFGNAYEREMSNAESSDYSWRESLIWGDVHDGNAHFLSGAAGHAGLFSTARETLRLATQFLAPTSILLNPETCSLFRTNLTRGLEEARSIAWQLAATPDSAAGPRLPPNSFGHLGFTGTSCWNDPSRSRTFILLTNRTHTKSLPFANINSTRRTFHTLAVDALDLRDSQPSERFDVQQT